MIFLLNLIKDTISHQVIFVAEVKTRVLADGLTLTLNY